MSRVIVFGAGGRAGQAVVAKALAAGHTVTAAVREPAGYAGAGDVVRTDVTDAAAVATAAAGHDVAVCAVYDGTADQAAFFTAAATALVAGLPESVWLLVWITVAEPPADAPHAYRDFAAAHRSGLEVLRRTAYPSAWVAVTPPPVVLDDAGYAELADEIVGEFGAAAPASAAEETATRPGPRAAG